MATSQAKGAELRKIMLNDFFLKGNNLFVLYLPCIIEDKVYKKR